MKSAPPPSGPPGSPGSLNPATDSAPLSPQSAAPLNAAPDAPTTSDVTDKVIARGFTSNRLQALPLAGESPAAGFGENVARSLKKNVVGQKRLCDIFLDLIRTGQTHNGTRPPGALLISGAPGSGRGHFARMAANSLHTELITLKAAEYREPYAMRKLRGEPSGSAAPPPLNTVTLANARNQGARYNVVFVEQLEEGGREFFEWLSAGLKDGKLKVDVPLSNGSRETFTDTVDLSRTLFILSTSVGSVQHPLHDVIGFKAGKSEADASAPSIRATGARVGETLKSASDPELVQQQSKQVLRTVSEALKKAIQYDFADVLSHGGYARPLSETDAERLVRYVTRAAAREIDPNGKAELVSHPRFQAEIVTHLGTPLLAAKVAGAVAERLAGLRQALAAARLPIIVADFCAGAVTYSQMAPLGSVAVRAKQVALLNSRLESRRGAWLGADDRPPQIASLENHLNANVIGQPELIRALGALFSLALFGERKGDPTPLASLLIPGPTGVGKTLAVRTLAKELGTPALIIEGADLGLASALTTLGGAPPTWIGHGSAKPKITNAILENYRNEYGFTVVFIDEYEKMHPDVRKWWLSVLGGGKPEVWVPKESKENESSNAKAKSELVDFSKCVIIAATNLGADLIRAGAPKNVVIDHIRFGLASPEGFGRFKDVALAYPLSNSSYRKVLKLEVKKLSEMLAEKTGFRVPIGLDEPAKRRALMAIDKGSGARAVSNLVVKEITPLFANALLENRIVPGQFWVVSHDPKNDRFRIRSSKFRAAPQSSAAETVPVAPRVPQASNRAPLVLVKTDDPPTYGPTPAVTDHRSWLSTKITDPDLRFTSTLDGTLVAVGDKGKSVTVVRAVGPVGSESRDAGHPQALQTDQYSGAGYWSGPGRTLLFKRVDGELQWRIVGLPAVGMSAEELKITLPPGDHRIQLGRQGEVGGIQGEDKLTLFRLKDASVKKVFLHSETPLPKQPFVFVGNDRYLVFTDDRPNLLTVLDVESGVTQAHTLPPRNTALHGNRRSLLTDRANGTLSSLVIDTSPRSTAGSVSIVATPLTATIKASDEVRLSPDGGWFGIQSQGEFKVFLALGKRPSYSVAENRLPVPIYDWGLLPDGRLFAHNGVDLVIVPRGSRA